MNPAVSLYKLKLVKLVICSASMQCILYSILFLELHSHCEKVLDLNVEDTGSTSETLRNYEDNS